MPIVGMPDGTQVSFPDEMPKERIRDLISQKFPDAAAKIKPAEQPTKRDASITDAVTDIPSEIANAASEGWQNIKGIANRGGQGPIEGLLTTAKVPLGALQVALSPFTGAARSLVGHPVAEAELALGGLINPQVADERRASGKAYEDAKQSVDTAMTAGAPGRPGPAVAAAAKPLTPGQEVVMAADRLSQTGSPVQIPRAVASDSMPVQQAGVATSNVPVAGTPLIKAAERTIEQVGTKADEVAKGYGSASPVSTTGEAARSSIKDWITGESAANSRKLYDKVDNLVDPDVKTPLDATRGAVADIAAKRDAAALSKGKATSEVLSAVQRKDGLTYEGVKTLRTNIGEMLNGGILPEGVSGSELKKIYGALSEDLNASIATAGGPEATAAFNRANKYYSLVSERRESLAKIIGADGNASAESVFGKLEAMAGSTGRADISKLAQARKAMGSEDWNELASTIISRLGRDVEGNFSAQRFVTAYGKLSDAGKNLLLKGGGKSELATHLDDIATVSSRFKELQKFANPSGTARNASWTAMGAGAVSAPLSTLATVLGGRVLASALSKPASAASIAKLSKAQQAIAANPTPSTLAAYTVAARNLISTLGVKDISPQDFLRSLQGPVPSRAQDEQR